MRIADYTAFHIEPTDLAIGEIEWQGYIFALHAEVHGYAEADTADVLTEWQVIGRGVGDGENVPIDDFEAKHIGAQIAQEFEFYCQKWDGMLPYQSLRDAFWAFARGTRGTHSPYYRYSGDESAEMDKEVFGL